MNAAARAGLRLLAMNWSTSKAPLVTAWSFSSAPTVARQECDERTSVGRKSLFAKVLFPETLGPIRTTRLRSWMLKFIEKELPHTFRAWQASADRIFQQILIHVPPSLQRDQLGM